MSVRHHFRRAETVSAVEAMRLVADADALVVDVRRDREHANNHVPGSVHIPLDQLQARVDELPDDRPLLTFCTGGLLSRGAANLLTELGFEAASIGRGLIEWRAAGGPLAGDRVR